MKLFWIFLGTAAGLAVGVATCKADDFLERDRALRAEMEGHLRLYTTPDPERRHYAPLLPNRYDLEIGPAPDLRRNPVVLQYRRPAYRLGHPGLGVLKGPNHD